MLGPAWGRKGKWDKRLTLWGLSLYTPIPYPICPPLQLGLCGPTLHFWGQTDLIHGFKVYFYGLVIAEFLFGGGITLPFGPPPCRLLCAANLIYCDALVRAPPLAPFLCE